MTLSEAGPPNTIAPRRPLPSGNASSNAVAGRSYHRLGLVCPGWGAWLRTAARQVTTRADTIAILRACLQTLGGIRIMVMSRPDDSAGRAGRQAGHLWCFPVNERVILSGQNADISVSYPLGAQARKVLNWT
jgi:hypothetical protein